MKRCYDNYRDTTTMDHHNNHINKNTPLLIQPLRSLPPLQLPATPTTPHHRTKRSKLLKFDLLRPKKPDKSAPKITAPCTECGKTFWSWKALFGHMRCHPERQWRGINPPPHLRRDTSSTSNASHDDLDHEVAASLRLLATSIGKDHAANVVPKARLKSLSHKKALSTHQSHKNVKGYLERGLGGVVNGPQMGLGLGLGSGLGYKCGVCFKVFGSGQALGGHMRCHWEKNEEAVLTSLFGPGFGPSPVTWPVKAGNGIDLNLPAESVEDVGTCVCNASSMQLELRLGI